MPMPIIWKIRGRSWDVLNMEREARGYVVTHVQPTCSEFFFPLWSLGLYRYRLLTYSLTC